MKHIKVIINILLMLISSSALSEKLVIQPKGFYDSKNGKIITDQYIYVKDGLIEKIDNKLDKKYKLLDIKDTYLLPGFIDSHSHIYLTQIKGEKRFEDALLRESSLNSQFRKTRAKKFLKQYLQQGFTSLFDLGNSGHFLDAELRDEIKDDCQYPDLFISGPGLASQKAQFAKEVPLSIVAKEYTLLNDRMDINSVLQSYVKKKIDILKIYLDNSPGVGSLDLKVIDKIFSFTDLHKFKKITFHSIGSRTKTFETFKFVQSLEHMYYILDRNQFPNVEYITLTDVDTKALKEFDFYWPALHIIQRNRLKSLLSDSKIKILFGPDFYFHSNDKSFNRAKYVINTIDSLKEGGLTANQILQSLTINPALSIKMEKSIGVISKNGYANFVGVTNNPILNIDTIKNAVFVMKKGRLLHFN